MKVKQELNCLTKKNKKSRLTGDHLQNNILYNTVTRSEKPCDYIFVKENIQ